MFSVFSSVHQARIKKELVISENVFKKQFLVEATGIIYNSMTFNM